MPTYVKLDFADSAVIRAAPRMRAIDQAEAKAISGLPRKLVLKCDMGIRHEQLR
jgi:hypothetical protein